MSSSKKHLLYLSRYREDKLELREMTPEEQWRLHDRLLEVELEILNNSFLSTENQFDKIKKDIV